MGKTHKKVELGPDDSNKFRTCRSIVFYIMCQNIEIHTENFSSIALFHNHHKNKLRLSVQTSYPPPLCNNQALPFAGLLSNSEQEFDKGRERKHIPFTIIPMTFLLSFFARTRLCTAEIINLTVVVCVFRCVMGKGARRHTV